ncbi:MAG: hypothetical protein R3E53_04905 [Myxococcota bacterium]
MHASAARPVDVDDRSPRAAITTPFWDAFLSGGLALVGMSLVLLWVATGHAAAIDPERFFALTILINTPHFLVSYRVLYASRARIRAHPGPRSSFRPGSSRRWSSSRRRIAPGRS